MTITPEQLAAFADNELTGDEQREVAALVAADPALAQQVEAHRALRQRLSAHFEPITHAPVPDHLQALLVRPETDVVDLAAARRQRETRRSIPRWTWLAAPALAASLVLAVTMPGRDGAVSTTIDGQAYASGPLAETLDSQLTADQPASAETRILLSFRNSAGSICRGFSGAAQAGIACRDDHGWRLEKLLEGARTPDTEYRQAGNPNATLLALAQDMATDGAMDAAQEAAAQTRGWR